ncbi:MAG: STAS/SEC14 domain-containing protein [Planctomycetes bacterium]|nr:STAS/SEC14 domain-containing protein [Planctomycetota bacterium]
MTIEMAQQQEGKVLVIRVSGKLTAEDYRHFVPEVERLIDKHGKLRVLFDMHDFHGWDAAALWEDLKFDLKHFKDIERLAMVGEKRWEKGMSIFCKPFTTAKIRYFDRSEADEAVRWLQGD